MAGEKPGNYFEEKALLERISLSQKDKKAAAITALRHNFPRGELPLQIQAAIAHNIPVSRDQLRGFKKKKKRNRPRR